MQPDGWSFDNDNDDNDDDDGENLSRVEDISQLQHVFCSHDRSKPGLPNIRVAKCQFFFTQIISVQLNLPQ